MLRWPLQLTRYSSRRRGYHEIRTDWNLKIDQRFTRDMLLFLSNERAGFEVIQYDIGWLAIAMPRLMIPS